MLTLDNFKKIYDQEKEEILKDYFHFLRFQSISTDPAYIAQTEECAKWLFQYLQKIGLKVELWPTSGRPSLFATYDGGGDETLLLYGHYDVQPVDPLHLWTTPPFEPTIRDGRVYARGAVDNKGQCFYMIRALKTLIEKVKPKLKIKVLIEGEEECGSVGLHGILREKKEALQADHILIVDAGFEKADQPALCLGVRGLVCFDLTLKISKGDFHSGSHGGIVYNPNRALAEVLSSLHDAEGRVAIDGFYDDVKEISKNEKKEFKIDFDLKHFETHFGAKAIGMEKGVSPLEATWFRPTCEINGISGGYSGAGFKTVIPAEAKAKISCRLVPDQDPTKIVDLLKKHIEKKMPKGIDFKLDVLPTFGKPVRSSPKSQISEVMKKAYSQVFGKECHFILMGGSIPVAAELAEIANAEILFIGVGLPEDQIHAPDEHFSLDRFEQGYLIICQGIQLL